MKRYKPHELFSLIFLLSISANVIHVSAQESYILSCGATNSDKDSDGRKWEPDTKYITDTKNANAATADYQDPSLPSTVPYMTARVFTAQVSYVFPVVKGSRSWIRLHFYPATYSNLDPNTAFFSVTANEFMLLNNFSAAITAQALTQAYIVREFSMVPIDSGSLNLTFTPSPNHNDSYAFVNGIEVISMPDIFKPAEMVGMADQLVDINSSVLQTMYRLNVGGKFIPATEDSGLTRTWYDDFPYLIGGAVGTTPLPGKIQYPTKDVPKEIAPEDVYSTARTMGPDPKTNAKFNLTWVFQVDANFTYYLRLHFCDYQIAKVNQRVFNIYIQNQTAMAEADVIAWSGAGVNPVYKDYAVFVSDQEGDDNFLWVALHPSVEAKPEYYDAILNGLEIFKINDSTGNLAGPNPVPSAMMLAAQAPTKGFSHSASKNALAVGGLVGGGCGLAFVAIVFLIVYRKKKNSNGLHSSSSSWLPLYGNSQTNTSKSTISGKSNQSGHLTNLAQGLCRHFSLAEIIKATKNFDESLVIGVGGFGKVYKGIIDQGVKVAIKRSNPSSEQGVNEFETEIEMLSKLRHKHLVSLIGFCEENGEMALIYDYMANGTFREHLYKSNKPSLSWKQRLEICIGAARGLHYLHTGARYTIIHRDVKTTNILLDEKWVAKVSDFGLSKTGPNMNQTHVSTVVKGSFGYLDPEYFRRQQLTEKSDVYSFGVVLFEALCARPALNTSLPKEQVSLADWALLCARKGTLDEIIDAKIKEEITPECRKKFEETALKCLSDSGINRPSMGDVLWNLEFALQLQENPDGDKSAAKKNTNEAYEMHKQMLRLLEDDEESEDQNSDPVFSQIVDPKGR